MKSIFGAMNLGQQVFGKDAVAMLTAFADAGGSEIDSAYVYNDGACEKVLGSCLEELKANSFRVATKANPRVSGRLDYDSVKRQLNESLERLGIKSVGIFYLHFPDESTPIEEAVEACSELYAEGKFKELGLSNFPLSLIEEMVPVCDKSLCPRPTVYEGVYNALSRRAECELLPSLDRLGMRFYAYNPLAGGMLTGKYRNIDELPDEGRFSLRAKSYQGRYWKDSYFQAVGCITEACSNEGISDVEAAFRWLVHHSMLNASRGDGIIVGASRITQLRQNLAAIKAGPLPSGVVEAMERAWHLTAQDAPEYYRFYRDGKAVG